MSFMHAYNILGILCGSCIFGICFIFEVAGSCYVSTVLKALHFLCGKQMGSLMVGCCLLDGLDLVSKVRALSETS